MSKPGMVEVPQDVMIAAARAFFRLHSIIQEMEAACRVTRKGGFPAPLAYKQALNAVHIQMHRLLPPESLEDVPA
jgi:hypothetical protein